MLAYQSSSVSSSIGLLWPLPALLTRMSTRPNCASAASAIAAGPSGVATSAGDRENLAPEAAQLVGGALEDVGAPRGDHEIRALGGEQQRDLPADSLAPAGDDGNPFPQAEFHGPERTQDQRSLIGTRLRLLSSGTKSTGD